MTGILTLIERERTGEDVNRPLLRSLLRMLSALQVSCCGPHAGSGGDGGGGGGDGGGGSVDGVGGSSDVGGAGGDGGGDGGGGGGVGG